MKNKIYHLKNKELFKANGAETKKWDPLPDVVSPSCRFISLSPWETTHLHNHSERELWTILEGQVKITLDGESVTLCAQDVIQILPLQKHAVQATQDGALIQTFWWQDENSLQQAIKNYADEKGKNKIHVVIPAMVTPNGPMHLGHASGPYIYGDVLRRALELQQEKAVYAVGTLGHQEHIQVSAMRQGLSYYELAKLNTVSVKDSFKRLNISIDVFLEPEPTARFVEIVHEIFAVLLKKGVIVERAFDVPYDTELSRFAVDAHVRGKCPYCQGHAFGMECECCGSYVIDAELLEPATVDGRPLSKKPLTRLFLRLSLLQNEVTSFLQTASLPTQCKTFIEHWLSKGLPDICISNPLTAGIEVNYPGIQEQRFMVAMEYVARHLIALEEWSAVGGKPRKWNAIAAEGDAQIDILFGSDNSFGRLIIIPALTAALGANTLIPKFCYLNYFLLLDNSKFSTSRNHAIWVNDFVNDHNSDAVRYYLTRERAETQEKNFTIEAFNRHIEEFWLDKFYRLIESLAVKIAEQVPQKELPEAGIWLRDDIRFYQQILMFDEIVKAGYRMSTFNPSFVTRTLETLVDQTTDYIAGTTAWPALAARDLNARRTELRLLYRTMISLSIALIPIAPQLAQAIVKALNIPSRPSSAWYAKKWFTDPLGKPAEYDFTPVLKILDKFKTNEIINVRRAA